MRRAYSPLFQFRSLKSSGLGVFNDASDHSWKITGDSQALEEPKVILNRVLASGAM